MSNDIPSFSVYNHPSFQTASATSHTLSEDTRSVRSSNETHPLPTVRSHRKAPWKVSVEPVFSLYFFLSFHFPKCVPPSNYFIYTVHNRPNTDFRCLRSAVHPCFHKVRPVSYSPSLPFFLHPTLQYHSRSICQVPSLPCRQHLPRSSVLHQ